MPEHNGKSVVIVEHFHHCQDSEPITLMETPFIEDVCRIDIICKSTNKPWTEINAGVLSSSGPYLFGLLLRGQGSRCRSACFLAFLLKVVTCALVLTGLGAVVGSFLRI